MEFNLQAVKEKMNKGSLKKNRDYILLSIIYVLNVVYDYIWLKIDTLPPGWDEATHLISTLSYFRILTHPSLDMVGKLIQVDTYYPPFHHFSTSIMYLFFGTSMDAAIMTNVVFLGILLVSTYGIGKELFNSETGLLAALIVSLYPCILGMQRFYLIEVALVAMVTLTIYMLILTDHFKNFKYSIAFGVALSLAVLTKWTAIFFIIGPLICVMYETLSSTTIEQSLKNILRALKTKTQKIGVVESFKLCEYCSKKMEKKTVSYMGKEFCSKRCKNAWSHQRGKVLDVGLINALCAGGTAFLVASIWYIPHIGEVYRTLSWGQQYWGVTEGDPEIFTLHSIIYYLFELINFQIFCFFFVLFVIGIVYYVKSKQGSKLFLFSWALVPYIVFTLIRNKNNRYTMPILVAVALISALWVSKIEVKKVKAIVISLILIVGGLQIFTMASGVDSITRATNVNTPFGTLKLYPDQVYGTRPPRNENWRIEEALGMIQNDVQTNVRTQGRIAYIGVIPDNPYINGNTFGYYCYREGMPLHAINCVYFPRVSVFYDNFLNFDYLVLKKGGNIAGYAYQGIVNSMYDFFEQNYSGYYVLIGEFELPDGSTLSIYKNIYTGG